jgi:hypothetical protein
MRRPHGYFYGSADAGRPFEADSCQCPHCGMHFIIEPKHDPAKLGRFCTTCMGQCCTKPACNETCLPFMKAIEQQEARARLRAQV